MSKEIIQKASKFRVPPIFSFINKTSIRLKEACDLDIESVQLEHKVSNIVPDILIMHKVKGHTYPLLVEIVVTNDVSDEKKVKIRELGIPAIRIDLSAIDRHLEYSDLHDILINRTVDKFWIYETRTGRHKDFLNSISESYPIIERVYRQHVDECPLKINEWEGRTYASLKNCDTCSCKTGIVQREGQKYILCSGAKKNELIKYVSKYNVKIWTPQKNREKRIR